MHHDKKSNIADRARLSRRHWDAGLTKGLRLMLAVLLAVWVSTVLAAGPSYQIRVDGLACPFCAYGIEKELNKIENVERIETEIKDGVVIVTMAEGTELEEETATDAVERAGFSPRGFEPARSDPDER